MNRTDVAGNPVSGASDMALRAYEKALEELHCYRGDPVATVESALEGQPDFVMGHVLHAWLNLLGTEPQGYAVAQADLQRAAELKRNGREQAHCEAISDFVRGDWGAAGRRLEDLSIAWPHDALALQAGHLIDFYRGDSRMLRDRLARVLPAWSEGDPGYHAVIGMYAFGSEETMDYERAEQFGRRALDLEPADAWAHHAVTHVLEMQGRVQEGIAWMRRREPHWAEDNFFSVHNWWHLALFHLDEGEVDQVLALFDGPIHGDRSRVVLDLVDASALLWRLELRGIDVRDRWETVAACWRDTGPPGLYAFNDFHAMMAWIGADDTSRASQWQAAQAEASTRRTGEQADVSRTVGEPLLRAIDAFARGDYRASVDSLRTVRPIVHAFGGSHAQRDLIDLTLIEAARRAGDDNLARALVAERVAQKPRSQFNRSLERSLAAAG